MWPAMKGREGLVSGSFSPHLRFRSRAGATGTGRASSVKGRDTSFRLAVLTGCGLVAILAGCAPEAPTVPVAEDAPPVADQPRVVPRSADSSGETFVSGRVLVRIDPQAKSGATGVSSTGSLTLEREIAPGLWIARVEVGEEESIAEALAASSNVMYAEPDYVRTLADPLCSSCQRRTPSRAWRSRTRRVS